MEVNELLYGNVRSYMTEYGCIWRCMGVYEHVSMYMKVYDDIWM